MQSSRMTGSQPVGNKRDAGREWKVKEIPLIRQMHAIASMTRIAWAQDRASWKWARNRIHWQQWWQGLHVFHHAHINDERDSPAAESAARSQNNYQNKSKEQERIILVHIAISMATWMIAMLSWAGQLALTTDSYPVAEWFDSIAHDETAMIIGQINVRIAFKCPHSPTGRDNGLRNHPVRVRIPVKAQFPPLCVMLGGMSNHMPVTWEQYCSHEHMWLQKYSTVRFDYGGRVCSPH